MPLPPPRYLFCLNSGRTGSQYLAHLLGTCPTVHARHEDEPRMTGEWVRRIEAETLEASRAERGMKVVRLREQAAGIPPGHTWCDTSNMFVKTFADVVAEAFADEGLEVIELRRPIAHVLKSFMDCGYFSDSNPHWSDYCPVADAASAAFRGPCPAEEMDRFEACITYLLDVEARGQAFRHAYPRVPVHAVTLAGLNDRDTVRALFQQLRLETGPGLEEILGLPRNTKTRQKSALNDPVSIETCRARVSAYRDHLHAAGVEYPWHPDFDEPSRC